MRERLVFEVADRELDDGVPALLGLHDRERPGAVGDEGVMHPGRQQFGLGGLAADAADDQPPAAEVVSAICAIPGWA